MKKCDITNNINNVLDRIESTCLRCGRNPEDVNLLLATKSVPTDLIVAAANHADIRIVGENLVQEAIIKYRKIRDLNLDWHFIGHIQSNKIRKVLSFASMIHSLDNLGHAERIQKILDKSGGIVDVLIQVNTSGEKSKYGVDPGDVFSFVKMLESFNRIRVKGLMTIALFSAEERRVRPCFRMLKELSVGLSKLRLSNVEMRHLSMGMSHDFEWAIEEGSTIVRIGSAVFGQRDNPDSYYWPGIN